MRITITTLAALSICSPSLAQAEAQAEAKPKTQVMTQIKAATKAEGAPSADEDLALQEPYATAVFRIVQEALANIAKHAEATQVSVIIDSLPEMITLTVRDNGRGFATEAPRKPHSLGLMGLRERALLLKGAVDIHSAPGQGTRVEVSIPLPQGESLK